MMCVLQHVKEQLHFNYVTFHRANENCQPFVATKWIYGLQSFFALYVQKTLSEVILQTFPHHRIFQDFYIICLYKTETCFAVLVHYFMHSQNLDMSSCFKLPSPQNISGLYMNLLPFVLVY
jgi:hypothetical protein